MRIEILDNDITKGDYDIANEIPIEMLESEKTAYGNEGRKYQEQNSKLENYRSWLYSLILGKFTPLLQDNMKQDTYWNDTSTSYNPLVLLQLIEKQYFQRQKTSICLQLFTIRNPPSTHLTKVQCLIHSVMSASTKRLMPLSPLECPNNTNLLWNIWHKRHIHWIFNRAQKNSNQP